MNCTDDMSKGVGLSTSICNFMYLSVYCLFKGNFNSADDKLITQCVWTTLTSYSVNTIPEAIIDCFITGLVIYRVIHKSLRDFRTRLRNNQGRHGRKELINRERERETLQVWRDSLPIDMLLSAVSVLVVAQSSSEIPERFMNNPVYTHIHTKVKQSR